MAPARAVPTGPAGGSADLLASNHQSSPPKVKGHPPSCQTHNSTSSGGLRLNTIQGSDNSQDQGKDDDDGADEADAEEDERRTCAPSGGSGLGQGKRPAIRIDSVDMSREEDRKAGSNQQDRLRPGLNKKRTFSSTSLLSNLESHDGEENGEEADFPRRKMARTLGEANGLLTYEGEQTDNPAPVPEHVLDSDGSDEDDEIYKAVEDIDPSDNDEYIDETLEEKALRKSYKHSSDDETDFGDIDGDGPDVSMLIQNGLIDDDFFALDDDVPSYPEYWDVPFGPGPNGDGLDSQDKPTTRRVRFDDQVHTVSDIDSDETSSEDLNSYWPDLFQNDPLVFRASNDPENVLDDAASDSERSYWDFGDDKDKYSDWDDEHEENGESDSDSEVGSSGYETDEGDTTDEELPPPPPPPPTITTPARIHRDSTSSASSATPKPLPRTKKMLPPKKPNRRKGPMRGFFAVDPRRSLAYIDATGKRMVLIPGKVDTSPWAVSTASSTANNSPKSQLMNADESEFSDSNNQSLSNLMALGGLFGTDLHLTLGFGSQWNPNDDDDLLDEDFDEDDGDYDMEDMLDVADFIDFGEESDSDEANETDALADGSPTKAHAGHTPAKSAAHEMSEKMLQHFDRGNVTSFRRNQNRYRDIARLPDDPALRASTSRPVRTGASADAIITPMRKKKRAKDPDTLQPRASPLSRKSGPISGTFGPRRV